MKLAELLVSTRHTALQLLDDTRDSTGSILVWDRTRSNSSTRQAIQALLEQSVEAARPFGIHLVVRHSPCGSSSHPPNDYLVASADDAELTRFQDERYEWTSTQLFQGARASACPCAPSARARSHHQIDEIIIAKGRATRRHRLFIDALAWIARARDAAGERGNRSAIREHLLRAVLLLNDGILPQGMDEFIAASDLGPPAA